MGKRERQAGRPRHGGELTRGTSWRRSEWELGWHFLRPVFEEEVRMNISLLFIIVWIKRGRLMSRLAEPRNRRECGCWRKGEGCCVMSDPPICSDFLGLGTSAGRNAPRLPPVDQRHPVRLTPTRKERSELS